MHRVTDEGKQRLLAFLGYGRLDAPVWFLGMEEAGGGEEQLLRRSEFEHVEDLRDAHRTLGITRFHERPRYLQPVWNKMCEVMLRIEGNPSPTTEERRAYQAERLGRSDGNSLLLELLPIPKPSIHAWNYPLTFPEYPDVDSYRRALLPPRIKLISRTIQAYQPRVVIAYGKAYWPDYQQTLEPADFTDQDGFLTGVRAETLMILVPFLSRKEMNGRYGRLAQIAGNWLEATPA